MRRAQNANTHALKQPRYRLSQNISPVCSSFVLVIASDMHLEPESEKGAKKDDLHTAKNIQTFSLFLDEFLETHLRPIYCSLTTPGPGQTPSLVIGLLPGGKTAGHRALDLEYGPGLPVAARPAAATSLDHLLPVTRRQRQQTERYLLSQLSKQAFY